MILSHLGPIFGHLGAISDNLVAIFGHLGPILGLLRSIMGAALDEEGGGILISLTYPRSPNPSG